MRYIFKTGIRKNVENLHIPAEKMIEKARKPLLIVGSQIHDKDVLERVIAFG